MTTPFTPAAPTGVSPNGHVASSSPPRPPARPPGERLPKLSRPRRPALAAGGALLVLLCGVLSAAVVTSADHRLRVLALARDVQAGQVLTSADLKVAEVAGSGVSALGADGAATVVGETVTASLPAGTLLNEQMLTTAPLPGSGSQLVAVAAKPGAVPEQAQPGRDVSLLRVAAASDAGGGAEATVLVARARLVSIRTDEGSGLQVLSVQVPAQAALAVAQASAAGAIAVTLLPLAP